MSKGAVSEIHFVCHDSQNVVDLPPDKFQSGWWPIALKHIRKVFFLHFMKETPIFLICTDI